MNIRLFCSSAVPAILAATALSLTSCSVDQEAALFTGGSKAGKTEKKQSAEKSESSFAEKMRIAKEERAKAREEAAELKAKEEAVKEREEARKLAQQKKEEEAQARKEAKEEARQKALAEKEAQEAKEKALAEEKAKEEKEKELAQKKALEKKEAEEARQRELAARKKAAEEKRAAKLAAREKIKADREAREDRESSREEVPAVAERRGGGGFFSRMAISTPSKYKSEGHYINVNQVLLSSLSPSNAKIEIDLSEQRARIYKNTGGLKQLVIETQVSTGKPGHTTPTGTFRIKEKLVEKRSTLYGTWVNSGGATVSSNGESSYRPAGASHFVGAEMPYWMRVSGGVGMHIGYVPNGPASHGCIRVPSAIQPLIYSKVGVGTPVTITY